MTEMNDEWRFWIAENLMLGAQAEDLKNILSNAGIDQQTVNNELATAHEHPYIKAGTKQTMRMQKREALLTTLDLLSRENKDYARLKKVPLPPFKKFLKDYYYKNKPGLFKGAFDHWPAREWTPRKLVEKVGSDEMVQIQLGREQDELYEINSVSLRRDIKLGQFVDLIENVDSSNDFYLTANNNGLDNLGLKKLMDELGDFGDGYLKPETVKKYGLLWLGPNGTVTPLHHDLNNIFFSQIYGRKKFRLIPSMQVPYMYNHRHVYSSVNLLNPDYDKFPDYKNITPIEFEVEPGDLLFIPIGWWHHVVGLSVNISISFTNINVPENTYARYPNAGMY